MCLGMIKSEYKGMYTVAHVYLFVHHLCPHISTLIQLLLSIMFFWVFGLYTTNILERMGQSPFLDSRLKTVEQPYRPAHPSAQEKRVCVRKTSIITVFSWPNFTFGTIEVEFYTKEYGAPCMHIWLKPHSIVLLLIAKTMSENKFAKFQKDEFEFIVCIKVR